MADQAIGELIQAQSIGPTDLFVLEQSSVAKSLKGQVLLNWLTAAADGHGGIQSIAKKGTSGLVDTYRITLADTTIFDFTVTNGRSVTKIEKTNTVGLVDTHTITYNDGTTSTFTVTNGEKGDKGDTPHIWIRYASQKPTDSSPSFGLLPDDWMGQAVNYNDTAPTDWKEYEWFEIKGEKGDTGAPATLISAEVAYQVGDSGTIIPSGAWSAAIPVVGQGKYLWTRTVQQYNTGDPVTAYSISRMGIDGSGSVSSVNEVSPDPDGNVELTAEDVGALPTSGGTMTGPINMAGQPISGLNPPTEGAHAANKGYVDTAKAEAISHANAVARTAAPWNLLGNSDFRNPVAQAGLNGLHGTRMYACDRWPEEGLTVTQSEAGLQFSVPSFGFIYQKIVEIQRKTVTLGYKTSNTSQVQIALYDGALTSQISVKSVAPKNGIVTSVFKVPDQYDIVSIVLYPANGEIIEWVDLYEGAYTADTFPEHRPKGYAQEFTECSRYYTRVHAEWISGDAVGGYGLVARVTCPAPMRISPTVLSDGVSAYVNNAWVELGPPSCRYIGAGMYDVVFEFVSGVEPGRSYLLRGLTGLSADL